MPFHFNKYLFSLLILLLGSSQQLYSQQSNHIELVSQIEKIWKKSGSSAALVILVDSENILVNQTFGQTDWHSNTKFNSSHLFRIGSISKTFAGLLALKMQQMGLINLKNPLDKHLTKPYIENNFKNNPITLEQLLEHSAGLEDLSQAEWDYNDSKAITIEQALALNKGQHKALWPPAWHSSYSNVGAAYLALALEKASNKSYEELLHEYVFKPLEMTSSNLLLTQYVKENLITGYNTDGKSKIPYWHNIYRPFAAINTDSKDMINFLQMFLNQGVHNSNTFLSIEDLHRLETPTTTLSAKVGLSYGYGLGNHQWQTNGYSFHGHGGDADGYLTRFAYQRDSGKAYFIMINAFQHKTINRLQSLLESHIIQDLPKPNYPQRLQLKPNTIQHYVGKYKQVSKRFGGSLDSQTSLEIYQNENQLFLKRPGYSSRIIFAVNEQLFRFIDESKATMAFIKHQNHLYLQGDFGNFKKIYP